MAPLHDFSPSWRDYLRDSSITHERLYTPVVENKIFNNTMLVLFIVTVCSVTGLLIGGHIQYAAYVVLGFISVIAFQYLRWWLDWKKFDNRQSEIHSMDKFILTYQDIFLIARDNTHEGHFVEIDTSIPYIGYFIPKNSEDFSLMTLRWPFLVRTTPQV
jgi:hypothetical protein